MLSLHQLYVRGWSPVHQCMRCHLTLTELFSAGIISDCLICIYLGLECIRVLFPHLADVLCSCCTIYGLCQGYRFSVHVFYGLPERHHIFFRPEISWEHRPEEFLPWCDTGVEYNTKRGTLQAKIHWGRATVYGTVSCGRNILDRTLSN